MSATITRAGDSASTTPREVLGYATNYEDRNIWHQLIGGGLAVVQYPQNLRSGTLELLYDTAAEAFAGSALHLQADTFTLVESDFPQLNMTYIPGTVSPALDDRSRLAWVVTVNYQEIEA